MSRRVVSFRNKNTLASLMKIDEASVSCNKSINDDKCYKYEHVFAPTDKLENRINDT